MIIDFHNHMWPKPWHAMKDDMPEGMFDFDRLFDQQQQAGADVAVISNTMFGPPEAGWSMIALDSIKEWNEFACETVARAQGRIVALTCTNPFGGDEYLKEMEYAVRAGGMRGVLINSSVKGEYLDSPRAYPFYTLACELDIPVFVHPPGETFGAEKMLDFRLSEMVGRPCDTTLSITRLILYGVLERFPTLKLVAAHMGGALMMLPGRLDFGYDLRRVTAFGPWEPDVLPKPPSWYISQIYVDTMGFHAPGVLCAIGTVGADHVVFGTDCPPLPIPLKKSVDIVRNLPIAERDREKILGQNAARLLKL